MTEPSTPAGPPADNSDLTAEFVDGLVSHIAGLEAEIGQLRGALESRAVIDQAKGMLMSTYKIGAEQAFAILAQMSQSTNVKLRAVAETMVARTGKPTVAPVETQPAPAVPRVPAPRQG